MRVGTALPLTALDRPEELVTGQGVGEVGFAAGAGGFASIAVSVLPFPDDDRLRNGTGHHNHDPFVALSFAAAATTTIRLRTALLVLPYRNPFLAARSVASL